MPHPVDVPPAVYLPRLATVLRERNVVQPPAWAPFVKTGVHAQQAPAQADWWYLRSASVLRKISLRGVAGIERLASEYGGKRDRGSAPYHARSGSRAIVREIVQQLESAGLVRAEKNRGRRVTAAGQKLLDTLARESLRSLAEQNPALARYL